MKQHQELRPGRLLRLPVATLFAAAIAAPLFLDGSPGLHRPPAPEVHPAPALLSEPVVVSILAREPGSECYTSRDGSLPTRGAGTLYEAPFTLDKTTVIRAASVRPWIADSHVATASYIFPADVALQGAEPDGFPRNWRGKHLRFNPPDTITPDYGMNSKAVADPDKYPEAVAEALRSLRTISLTADSADLFDLETGIYVNATEEGGYWERPVSFELFQKDGTLAFQANAGIRMHGAVSRWLHLNKKQGFRILFRREYGTDSLRYPVFGPDRQTGFDALLLRNLTQDSWATQGGPDSASPHYIRDQFARESQRVMGHPAIEGEFVHLYLNGLYWGIYNLCERLDGSFLSDRFGGAPRNFDIMKRGLIVNGTEEAWDRIAALSRRENDDAAYDEIATLVELDSLIDYVLLNQFIANTDWYAGNSLAARSRKEGGRFLFFMYDSEVAFGSSEPGLDHLDFGRLAERYAANFSPMQLFHQLKFRPEFKLRVADRIHRHYFNGGALTVDAARERWKGIAGSLDTAIVAESARWGDCNEAGITRTREADWRPAIAQVATTFFDERTELLMAHYAEEGLLSPAPPATITPHGGRLEAGAAVSLSAEDGEIYYTVDGRDPRAPGGTVNAPSARVYNGPISLAEDGTINVRARVGDRWSALTSAAFRVSAEQGALP